MPKTSTVELLAPHKQRQPGHPRKFQKLRKLTVEIVEPESQAQAVEDLLLFDAHLLDAETRRELVRLVPRLMQARRAWAARFAEYGCISCRRKKVPYASGGFCARCAAREGHRMRAWFRKLYGGRDIEAETAAFADALQLRYNAAQRLLGGEK